MFKKLQTWGKEQQVAITGGATAVMDMRLKAELETIDDTILAEAEAILQAAGAADTENVKRLTELQRLGFANAEVQENQRRLADSAAANKRIELVNHYKRTYPFNKFITDGAVANICQKYGLLTADVSRFTATIPVKNQLDIINFRFRLEDRHTPDFINNPLEPSAAVYFLWGWGSRDRAQFSYPDCKVKADANNGYIAGIGMKIVAPQKELNMERTNIMGHSVVDARSHDPIVLQPVMGGYLIVTAWGPEANDPEVMNERLN